MAWASNKGIAKQCIDLIMYPETGLFKQCYRITFSLTQGRNAVQKNWTASITLQLVFYLYLRERHKKRNVMAVPLRPYPVVDGSVVSVAPESENMTYLRWYFMVNNIFFRKSDFISKIYEFFTKRKKKFHNV